MGGSRDGGSGGEEILLIRETMGGQTWRAGLTLATAFCFEVWRKRGCLNQLLSHVLKTGGQDVAN